jgi:hypothetical protein
VAGGLPLAVCPSLAWGALPLAAGAAGSGCAGRAASCACLTRASCLLCRRPPELITEGILTKAAGGPQGARRLAAWRACCAPAAALLSLRPARARPSTTNPLAPGASAARHADVYAFGVITWEIYVGRYARQLSCGLCATNVLRCAACCTAPKHLWPAGSGPLVVLPPWLATNAPHRARHPLARPCLAATPLQACVGWAEAHRGAPQGGLQYAPRLPAADTAPTQGTHLPVSVVFSLGN